MSQPASSTLDAFESARERVAQASREVAAKGLVIGTGGNLSERIEDHVAITATGAVLESLDPSGVTIVDRAGNVVHGEQAPSSELFLHLGIYDHYDAGAVVHTHSPVATALGTVLDELPCIHYQMLMLGGSVPVADYRTFGTAELAEATIAALDGKAAALMANHGAIVHAHDLRHAVENALLLEWACTVYWRAAAIGEPRSLGDEELQKVVEASIQRSYGSTRERE